MNTVIIIWTKAILIISLMQLSDCQGQSKDASHIQGQIILSTDRESYTVSDTIRLLLENGSAHEISVGLRCSNYLEMSYNKKEIQNWSEDLFLRYMYLRCPTLLNTINAGRIFTNSLPAEMFNSTGTFILQVDISLLPDSSLRVVSNPFQIN
jgi:hypothetical protein